MQTCRTCGESKDESCFRKHRRSCKACCRKAGRKYETPEKKKDRALKSKYDISLSDYERMYRDQRGLCFLCNKPNKLFVDHCHLSGEVRKLLCNNCNLMLGHAKDDPALLRLAAYYLELHDRNSIAPPEAI